MKLGRNPNFVTVPFGADISLIGPNPKRYAILIGAPPANRITLGFGGAQPVVLDQGVNLYTGTLPLLLAFDHVGNAIREEIRAIAAVANQLTGFVEFFWT